MPFRRGAAPRLGGQNSRWVSPRTSPRGPFVARSVRGDAVKRSGASSNVAPRTVRRGVDEATGLYSSADSDEVTLPRLQRSELRLLDPAGRSPGRIRGIETGWRSPRAIYASTASTVRPPGAAACNCPVRCCLGQALPVDEDIPDHDQRADRPDPPATRLDDPVKVGRLRLPRPHGATAAFGHAGLGAGRRVHTVISDHPGLTNPRSSSPHPSPSPRPSCRSPNPRPLPLSHPSQLTNQPSPHLPYTLVPNRYSSARSRLRDAATPKLAARGPRRSIPCATPAPVQFPSIPVVGKRRIRVVPNLKCEFVSADLCSRFRHDGL